MIKPTPDIYVAIDSEDRLASFWGLVSGLSLNKALRIYKRRYDIAPTTLNYMRLRTIANLAAREIAAP